MPHTTLDHTADTGLEATATTLPALIEELATGMFELMSDSDCHAERSVETAIEASSVEDLVVDSLSEMLYLAETEDLHLCRFEITETGHHTIRIEAWGTPTSDIEHTGPSIKAVTYHQLEVSESEDGWYASVYFDV